MPAIDWGAVFMFSMSPVELIVRGTLVYWFLFCIFRYFLHRDVGELGIADLLVLVIIADASQNAMGSEYKSVSDGFVLIATIASWSYLFNFLSFRYPRFRRFTAPGPLCLVRDGRRLRQNMRRQFITDEELDAMVRSHGIEHIEEIKRAYLESDGQLSVITYSKDERSGST